jgi:hypothetical protein
MNHKPCAEERQIIQWPNEPQAMHRRKTDNTKDIVLSVFLLCMACGSLGHCIICLSSVYDLWFIWQLNYLSFFYSYKPCAEERQILQWPTEPQAMRRRKTDNTMAK